MSGMRRNALGTVWRYHWMCASMICPIEVESLQCVPGQAANARAGDGFGTFGNPFASRLRQSRRAEHHTCGTLKGVYEAVLCARSLCRLVAACAGTDYSRHLKIDSRLATVSRYR
eukprot:2824592-Pleurochrysis_carterae.AAC.3